ncbi:MAG TPA: hypothetical protein VMW27_02255 [Thermoanaerobaculia bacterium]|nr:hypothetical protein [Thermoanaerobaculia bacterium]
MSTHRILAATLLAASLALAAGPAAASHQEATLGNAGELYVLRTGTYGQLFPTGTEVDKDNPVLALDVQRPGAAVERRLVAGTREKDVEGTPATVFEDDSSTLFVIWESRINSIHSIFRLASFDGSGWSNPIDITGNPFSVKTPPQIAVTRDSHREPSSDGTPATIHHRTVLHISWAEENGAGLYDAFYTPIILDEGSYLGWNPVYRLDTFASPTELAAPAVSAAAPELVRAPTVQPGQDGRTVVAAFASSTSGEMSAIEIDVLPSQLQRLADKARGYIIDLGVRRKLTDLTAISTRARTFIVENGDDYQPEVARSIADQVAAYVLSNGGHGGPLAPGGITNIAEGARGYIIDLGAKFSGRGLKSAALAGDDEAAPPRKLEIAASPEDAASDAPAHIFQVRIAAGRTAPEIGTGAVRVFASEAGDEILVSWAGTDRVTYRISQGNGWSDPREILLSDNLELNGVYDILAQRVRRR